MSSEIEKPNSKRAEDVYYLFRDYIKQEDGLINNRMTWLITIQAFLITTFGFSYQKRFEVVGKAILDGREDLIRQATNEYDVMLIFLSIIGIATSYIALRSVNAALDASDSLKIKWDTLLKNEELPTYLPNLGGGCSDKALKEGKKFPTMLPWFFIGIWLVVLVILVTVLFIGVAGCSHNVYLLRA